MITGFFLACGVVLGGSLLGAMGACLGGEPPLRTMVLLADRLKIWAMVTALGGTFEPIRVIEGGVLRGEFGPMLKQLVLIFTAFCGCQLGYLIIAYFAESG